MRKLVVLKPHEWLRDAFATRTPAAATYGLEVAASRFGARLSTALPPIALPIGLSRVRPDALQRVMTSSVPVGDPHQFVISADFESDFAADEFAVANPDLVHAIFTDPEIMTCPPVCPTGAIGAAADVLMSTRMTSLHAANFRGRGVRIVVVDTGIDGTQVNVSGGIAVPNGPPPGMSQPDHGTMVAMDALIAAPDAMIYDCPLLKSKGGLWIGLLSDAIRAFAEILTTFLGLPGRYVVTNSWAMYDTAQDTPRGSPQNYSANPTHPFNLMVGTLAAAGIDVLFAAGNCGVTCPDPRCGASDRGPGKSILGANSHPNAISVAAVTVHDVLLGYSSQGPGQLSASKPDVAAPSHFHHSAIYPADSGTSAACPVVAGVVAALRSTPQGRVAVPDRIRSVLTQSARQIGNAPQGWNQDTGWGVVDAAAALTQLP